MCSWRGRRARQEGAAHAEDAADHRSAQSPDKDAALAGLDWWRARHPDASAKLAVDDVLVDSMRGRSSTWTRIRVNLRQVPQAERPPQEKPDPDEDPTAEWRAMVMKAAQRGG